MIILHSKLFLLFQNYRRNKNILETMPEIMSKKIKMHKNFALFKHTGVSGVK